MHARYSEATQAAPVSVTVGDETIVLGPADTPARVTARLDAATLLELLHGHVSVLDAALADRLLVLGAPEDLLGAGDAMEAFLEGAARSPSFPGLLADLETAIALVPRSSSP